MSPLNISFPPILNTMEQTSSPRDAGVPEIGIDNEPLPSFSIVVSVNAWMERPSDAPPSLAEMEIFSPPNALSHFTSSDAADSTPALSEPLTIGSPTEKWPSACVTVISCSLPPPMRKSLPVRLSPGFRSAWISIH